MIKANHGVARGGDNRQSMDRSRFCRVDLRYTKPVRRYRPAIEMSAHSRRGRSGWTRRGRWHNLSQRGHLVVSGNSFPSGRVRRYQGEGPRVAPENSRFRVLSFTYTYLYFVTVTDDDSISQYRIMIM